MALPPEFPYVDKLTNEPTTYFQKHIKEVEKYFVDMGVELNFNSYLETIKEYNSLNDWDKEKAWRLCVDLNLWSRHFASLKTLTKRFFLDAETDKIKQISVASIDYDAKTASNGKRGADKDDRVVEARKRRNAFEAFLEALEEEMEFTNRAFYHVKLISLKEDSK